MDTIVSLAVVFAAAFLASFSVRNRVMAGTKNTDLAWATQLAMFYILSVLLLILFKLYGN